MDGVELCAGLAPLTSKPQGRKGIGKPPIATRFCALSKGPPNRNRVCTSVYTLGIRNWSRWFTKEVPWLQKDKVRDYIGGNLVDGSPRELKAPKFRWPSAGTGFFVWLHTATGF